MEKYEPETIHFPPVDPADLLARWKLFHGIMPRSVVDVRGEESKSDANAAHGRAGMLLLMERHGLLKDWIHDGELNEIVIQVMAKFPLSSMAPGLAQKAPYYEILEEIKKVAEAS